MQNRDIEPEQLVITAEDLAALDAAVETPPARKARVPLWWRLPSIVLLLFPPILFVVTIGGLLAIRRRDLPVRYAYTFHYLLLLLAGGILWATVLVGLALWGPRPLFDSPPSAPSLSLNAFPSLPSAQPMSGREIAQQLSPLVVVVRGADSPVRNAPAWAPQASGAGLIACADSDGCLILTSRHVVDALTRAPALGRRVGVSLKDGQRTQATVVGLHNTLDLALLLASRNTTSLHFAQPCRPFNTVEIGEPVFVIGHPEGLDFSLSGGLVAQTRGDDLLQITAPVSPGNSGGPVYDAHGCLLAVVQSVFDKTKRPNAENLNFAVRADDVLTTEAWMLLPEGRRAVEAFADATESVIGTQGSFERRQD